MNSQYLVGMLRDISFDAINSVHYWRHNLTGNKVVKTYISGRSSHPPVILLQGFLGTRGVLRPLEYHLKSEGRDVISLDLGFFNISDIRTSSHLLQLKIERIIERHAKKFGIDQVDIVGHSMGGLIGLYYVKRLGGHTRVRNLVTLGTPFNGTWACLLAMLPLGLISKGLWQMLPQSDFLKELRAHSRDMHQTKVVSISAKYDTICPPKSCNLRFAKNQSIAVGHGGLLMDQRVFEAVSSHLPEAKPSSKIVRLHK